MKSVLKEHGAEALIGLLVVILAIWFVVFAWQRTGGGSRADAIHVTALFPNATGINVGTDVRVAGLKIGQVSAQRLDPKTYEAEVTLALNPNVKLPADSAAAITSEGILGGSYIAMIPGGDSTPLKNGDTIVDTQGSVDLMGMIGQFVNHSGGGSGGSGGSGTMSSPNPTSPPTP